MSASAQATTATWRRAGEAKNSELAASCLADNVQVISPLTARFRFVGRDQARTMLDAAFAVMEEFDYHTEVGDERTRALFYRGRCRGEAFEEAQLVRFDEDGLIVELTLFGRPLPGVTAVMTAIGPRMLQDRDQPTLARLIAAASAPLALLARQGERHLVPLADPSRRRSTHPSQ